MKILAGIPKGVFILAATLACGGISQAAILINIIENGSDVEVDVSGSWDTWTDEGTETIFPPNNINGTNYFFSLPNKEADQFFTTDPFEKTSGIWTSESINATTISGDNFGFSPDEEGPTLYAPVDYSAGDEISSKLVFEGKSIPDLGFTYGDSGAFTGDDNTANFTVAAIPEPNSYGFLLGAAGLATAIFFRRRRRSSAS